MKFSAEFVSSYASITTLPTDGRPEVAMIGRSNVGKSSLINALVDRKQLAKTSSTPGKTQLLNYFIINSSFYLVDMPGYGYAKTAKTKRADWAKLSEDFFLSRSTLRATGILVDSRHPNLESDVLVVEWFNERSLPYFVVLTKTDKTTQLEVSAHERILKEYLHTSLGIFKTSSEKGRGIQELRSFIQGVAMGANVRT